MTTALIRTVALAGVSALALAPDAYAQTDDGGLLLLKEEPLDAAALGEARGGFKIGGLIFDIKINVGPIEVNPIPDDGVFGEDGVFGPGGVFGDGGKPGDAAGDVDASEAAPSPAPQSSNASQPDGSSSPTSTASNTPAQDAAPSPSSSPTTTASNKPAAPSGPAAPTDNEAPMPTSAQQAQSKSGPAISNAPGAQTAAENEPEASMSFGMKNAGGDEAAKAITSPTTLVLNNAMDRMHFAQTIDIDVVVRNFDAYSGLIRANNLTTDIRMNHTFLGALN